MAINYTISYTFSPGTTISSSQVNTNFSDNANTWTGLEALTKSFSNLRVDTLPTTSTDVAIKSYVDKLNAYRRPVLQFGSVTTVAIESGLDGTSGDIPLLFPDGTFRTETSTTRTTFDITRNAVLVTSGAQSGLTGATSEATNTWYALYGCKVTDSSTLWCTVGSTVFPSRANFATLNTAYGTNGWVYLGMIANGDNAAATGDIAKFRMAGHRTAFSNRANGATAEDGRGLLMATTAGATSLTWTYAAGGSVSGQVPAHILVGDMAIAEAATTQVLLKDAADAIFYTHFSPTSGANTVSVAGLDLTLGFLSNPTVSIAQDIFLTGFYDSVLGVGANPLL